ncbi:MULTISPECIES: cytidylate kinase-like family protein [Pseudobutyrivibrio]|jgi:cytidylate kinase|uniref:Cytidylate kinase-like family protein n=3 Tax=Pseudobutyrivibrio TaxID=46205 RepID=A0A2G3DRF4_9FIRM|nr:MULTISPECIES: cytidylate kinase-like family protein [Pseudobutyrivibrio]MBE5903911.1 cytidylate kinase-like family protein [Pseudobutyrivibrio sp.]NEX01651.1 cytidylate kinase-like family protein [Pseudobutyrivibrio xylanivorans]PHU33612.1 cytidylate kinase-like family protein [Pseudobutyrivibrio ruminis]SCY20907.1 cytidylate kinase [Pseudobutyrivibrio sp. AR14]SFR70762.1 cytidylate kinase [Pseudobutyrivibrio sp. NOR37]
MGQFIISVGREYGSGGHEIASILSEKFDIPMYDRNMLDQMAEKNGIDSEELHKHEEMKHQGLHRTVRGHSSSIQDTIAQLQFDFIRNKAASGESFVVVGRCAENVLRDNPALISIFVRGDEEAKTERICRLYKLNKLEAKAKMFRHDKKRKAYHNYYSKMKWGDSRGYDFCVNSSLMGVEATAEALYKMISEFLKSKEQ